MDRAKEILTEKEKKKTNIEKKKNKRSVQKSWQRKNKEISSWKFERFAAENTNFN